MKKRNPDMDLIRKYFAGELTSAEMYALERHAQDDPMLMDIMLGMEQGDPSMHKADLQDIRKRLELRLQQRPLQRLRYWKVRAVAATILLAAAISILWLMQPGAGGGNEPTLANRQTAPVVRPAEPLADGKAPERGLQATPETNAKAPQQTAVVPDRKAHAAPNKPSPAGQQEERLAMLHDPAEDKKDTLDETVVVGFSQQNSADLTGAVTNLDAVSTGSHSAERGLALNDRRAGIRIRGIGETSQRLQTITGKVVDPQTEIPMAGVALRLVNDSIVVTDSSGSFVITDLSLLSTTTMAGYKPKRMEVTGTDSISIILEPDLAELSEVVIGRGGDKRQAAYRPMPSKGWRAYRRYLKREARQAEGLKGTVVLTFTVGDNGMPTNIRVVRTTNDALNGQAIQLVREGPKWKPGKDGSRTVVELPITF